MSRPNGHSKVARTDGRRSKLYSWIKKIQHQGLEPEVRIVEYCELRELDEAEIFWIKFCRDAGCPLSNITDGGRNGAWFAGEDERKRRSTSRLGPLHPMFGKQHRPETVKKMKRAHAGRRWTPEQIEKRAVKRRRPFRCIETGEVFASIEDFISKGRGSSRIKSVLNGHCETFKGLHYERIT